MRDFRCRILIFLKEYFPPKENVATRYNLIKVGAIAFLSFCHSYATDGALWLLLNAPPK